MRLAVMYGNLLSTKVSIHASVKDATIVMRDNRIEKIVSIHASVKDATEEQGMGIVRVAFQSTHL